MVKAAWALATIAPMPQTLTSPARSELILKKSRFLCCVEPMASRALAQERVQALRQQHPGAAHVCWALLAGGQSAANDDGEPGGTAGRPMLDVLRHQDLEGVLATVVRYFGGVKLGAGGLVRAYTDAVAQALLAAKAADQFKPLQRMASLTCSVPYALEGWVRREVQAHHATLLDVSHTSVVTLHMTLPEPQAAALVARLNDGGQGHLAWISAEQNTP